VITLCGFGISPYYNKLKLLLLEKDIPFRERLVYPWERDTFRPSSPLGKIKARVDFKEEHGLSASREIVVEKVLFIADTGNNRIRRVAAGVITTLAGSGAFGYQGEGADATKFALGLPGGVAVDNAGNLYIAENTPHLGGSNEDILRFLTLEKTFHRALI
jgi:hypothetical protein